MTQPANPQPPRGWILYDDSCGVCRRWVALFANTLRRHGFGLAPLQAAWVRDELALEPDRLLDDLRLLLADGRQLAGADVYRHVMRCIGWAWPLYLFSITPGLRRVFDGSYRTFAANRHRVAGACGLRRH